MIWDRTKADVDTALKIRREKVQQGLSLTDADKNTLERGFMTVSTINRIEQKQAELKGLLNSAGYWNTAIAVKNWDETKIFSGTDFVRLIDNAKSLRNAFFVYPATPNIPSAQYHYENINALERNLFDIGEMVDDVRENYRECGAFECGGD